MNKYQLIIIFLLIFILAMPAGAFKDNFQYESYAEMLASGHYSSWFPYTLGTPTLVDSKNRIVFSGEASIVTLINCTVGEEINYAAWTQEVQGGFLQLDFYDVDYNLIGTGNFPIGGLDSVRYEIRRIGNTWKGYINGHYNGDILVTATSAYHFRIYSMGAKIDNLIVGDVDTNIIGGMNDGWYIRRDMLSPLTRGLYNATGNNMNTNQFSIDWAVGSSGSYTIRVQHYTGTTINSTSWTADYTNATDFNHGLSKNMTYYIDNLLIDSSAPYGMYEVRLLGSTGGVLDTTWFYYIATGADIQWDRETYSAGDDAVLTTIVSAAYWDTANYEYEGRIYDLYGTKKASWTITSDVDTQDESLSGYDTGDYVAVIVATKKSDGSEFWMDYDIATISDYATITGYGFNAYTGAVIKAASVKTLQGGTWRNTTTDGTGIYNVTELNYGLEIGINATKAGYNFTAFAFTPPAASTYHLNLSFVPDYVANHTALMGVVYEDWSHNAIPGATVYISNDTWTGASTTASSMGFYMFDSLCAGITYRINSSASGYEDSVDYSRSPISGLALLQNVEMTPTYILGVACEDATSGTLITDSVTVDSSDGQTVTTTNGRAQFTLDFGSYTITGYSDGYYGTSRSVVMTGDRNITLSFTRESAGTGAGIAYPPHQVRFTVKNMWGAPLEGIKVTAQGYETTAGSWEWLKSLLGMDLDTAPIHNATMEGYTGRDGAIVFMMIENVKYEMALTNATQGVSSTYEVYPKDDYYEIWVTTGDTQWWSTGYDAMEEINISVTKVRLNSTYGHINITYKDALAGTTNVNIYINQSDKTGVDKPDTIVGASLGIASSDFTRSFLVPADDDSYFVVFGITHSTFGNIVRTFSVIWEKVQVGIGVPSSWLMYMAVFFILFTGMFFGAITSPTVGAVITCFVGWVMWSIGWLAEMGAMAPTALVFATVISVLSVVMTRSRKERYL